jgi:hypothetical protein
MLCPANIETQAGCLKYYFHTNKEGIMINISFPILLAAILPVWALYRVSVFFKCKKLNLGREVLISIFLIYLLGVAYLTFFSVEITLYDWHPSINFIPIKETIVMIKYGAPRLTFVNLAGNILLLFPLGDIPAYTV